MDKPHIKSTGILGAVGTICTGLAILATAVSEYFEAGTLNGERIVAGIGTISAGLSLFGSRRATGRVLKGPSK